MEAKNLSLSDWHGPKALGVKNWQNHFLDPYFGVTQTFLKYLEFQLSVITPTPYFLLTHIKW